MAKNTKNAEKMKAQIIKQYRKEWLEELGKLLCEKEYIIGDPEKWHKAGYEDGRADAIKEIEAKLPKEIKDENEIWQKGDIELAEKIFGKKIMESQLIMSKLGYNSCLEEVKKIIKEI